jgi:hypothetical protein
MVEDMYYEIRRDCIPSSSCCLLLFKLACCCLLLQYLFQSCPCGRRGIVEDMCYEIYDEPKLLWTSLPITH